MDINRIKEKAKRVLEGNIVQNEEYFYTCPSTGTYQHQWLWDSCFHAIIWSYFNPENAKKELHTLIKKQFENGMIPHTLYWKRAKGAFPRLTDWFFKRLFPENDRTHITQPPLLAEAVLKVYETTNDTNFLESMLPSLIKYYDWLHDERNEQITGDGLVSIIHPWESGMDLLPVWDHIHGIRRLFTIRTGFWLRNLIKEYNKVAWNIEKMKERNLFFVKDVAFNVIYIINLKVLANLCAILGQKEKKKILLLRAEKAQSALINKCWDDKVGFFYSIRSLDDVILPEISVTGLFPLLLEIGNEKAERLVKEHLLNEEEFWLPFPIPSVAKSSPKFNPKGSSLLLWRGPTWFCTNWYSIKGLQQQGFNDLAKEIIIKMCEMIEKSGFREQYNPITGKPYGAKNFGWSTLIVDLL
ncbi:MAG TPA: trehalase family glycosidase [Candidatus Deferrimicrobium sp.]|nr:trehalase family glycosidase [Candidatus Deferrimicrobium sp.]